MDLGLSYRKACGLFQWCPVELPCHDDQRVKVSAVLNFKLHIFLIFLDLDRFGVLPLGCEQEALDVPNCVRRGHRVQRARLERQAARSEQTGKEGSAFVTSSPTMLKLLFPGPHF